MFLGCYFYKVLTIVFLEKYHETKIYMGQYKSQPGQHTFAREPNFKD